MVEDRFSRHVIDTVAKRAGNICSNPDCQALTTGPAETEDKSISIGEAAHIFGANPGSARFSANMSSAERSDITNAIWLCRNCHKLVDADPIRFPTPLLFEWRRQHEQRIIEKLGKPGDIARQRVLSRELEEFKNSSDLAQQILIDKPRYWEYKLTTELLRHGLAPVLSRWRSLSKSLYAKPVTRIPAREVLEWVQTRMAELSNLTTALSGIINVEIPASWGPPGVPASESEMLRTCDLLIEACQRVLEWEESVRFVSVPESFKPVQDCLVGIGGRVIEKAAVIPAEFAKIFEQDDPKGTFSIQIVTDLPDGWAEKIGRAMKVAVNTEFPRGF